MAQSIKLEALQISCVAKFFLYLKCYQCRVKKLSFQLLYSLEDFSVPREKHLKYFPPKVIQLVIHDHSAGNWTLKLMLSLTITIMTWNLLAPTGNHKINSVQLGFLIEPHNIKLNHYNRSRCICIWNSVTYKLQNVVSYHVIWPIWYVAVLGTEPASFYVEVHYEVGKICILKQ